MTVQSGVPRKGQVVKYRPSPRRGGRIEYMRLLRSAEVRQMESGPWLTLWGYKCRATGLPVNIRPSARFLPAAGVEIVVTPEEEARRALHGGTSRDGLSAAAHAEYDRLLALVMRANPEIGSGDTTSSDLNDG